MWPGTQLLNPDERAIAFSGGVVVGDQGQDQQHQQPRGQAQRGVILEDRLPEVLFGKATFQERVRSASYSCNRAFFSFIYIRPSISVMILAF